MGRGGGGGGGGRRKVPPGTFRGRQSKVSATQWVRGGRWEEKGGTDLGTATSLSSVALVKSQLSPNFLTCKTSIIKSWAQEH